MNKRKVLPDVTDLKNLFFYEEESGQLLWKVRPLYLFKDSRSHKIWNTRYSGKVAGAFVEKDGVKITLKGKSFPAHRIVYKMKTGFEPSHIDHKDGNPKNNRLSNLRAADDKKNGWNSSGHKNTVSGLKGVYYNNRCKSRPWIASVNKDGKCYRGGYFATKEEAFLTACKLRESLHGSFFRHF